MPQRRAILHVDMDAFFAAIEQLDHPDLRGKPILIGSDTPRAVVSTASYEARVFGCRSAMPMAVAKRLCPQAIIVPPNGSRIREISHHVFTIFQRYTPLIEPLSVDEAFIDLTGTHLLDSPLNITKAIRHAILAETGLTASAGLAPNKFLAKLASDHHKPDGLTVIEPGAELDFLAPLPIQRMWGIGPAAADRLKRFAIHTIGDLQQRSLEQLHPVFGHMSEHFYQLARGIDDRPVVADHQAKSIGQERTFAEDQPDPDIVRSVLLAQVEQVGFRLRRHNFTARGVTVKIRYGDFHTITRAMNFDQPTDLTHDLWLAAKSLFDRWAASSFHPVRLIGATATHLHSPPGQQIPLFPDLHHSRQQHLDRTMDQIRTRFGKSSISRAATPLPPSDRNPPSKRRK